MFEIKLNVLGLLLYSGLCNFVIKFVNFYIICMWCFCLLVVENFICNRMLIYDFGLLIFFVLVV